jgi:hypothetical protein
MCADGACVVDPTSIPYCDKTIETACLLNQCEPETGKCALTPSMDGEPCDDGMTCTEGDHCESGECAAGAIPNCDDFNSCTEDSCDDWEGCLHEVLAEGAGCDDGVSCTTDDHCSGGLCFGYPKICDDSNPCTDDSCAPATGQCVFANNTKSCNDKNLCTYNDKCDGGICYGTYVICDDKNPCTEDACKPDMGACVSKPVDGQPCDDGNYCTVNDECLGASCLGIPKNCGDSNPCTVDSCKPGYGCQHSPAADGVDCDDKDWCTDLDSCAAGECGGLPVDCDDGDPCTEDSCLPESGCSHAPKACE